MFAEAIRRCARSGGDVATARGKFPGSTARSTKSLRIVRAAARPPRLILENDSWIHCRAARDPRRSSRRPAAVTRPRRGGAMFPRPWCCARSAASGCVRAVICRTPSSAESIMNSPTGVGRPTASFACGHFEQTLGAGRLASAEDLAHYGRAQDQQRRGQTPVGETKRWGGQQARSSRKQRRGRQHGR